MFIKKKAVSVSLCIPLGLAVLYTGVCSVATLCRAITQPHLLSGTVRFDFLGYYMMAAAYGAVCFLFLLATVLVAVKSKLLRPISHNRKKERTDEA